MQTAYLMASALIVMGSLQTSCTNAQETATENQSIKSQGKITIQVNGDSQTIEFGDQLPANDKEDESDALPGDHEMSIQTIITGHGIVIGPDGQKREFRIGDPQVDEDALKGLPEPVRKRIEAAMKNQAANVKIGKGIMIGPNGKSRLFDLGSNKEFQKSLNDLPKDAQKTIEDALQRLNVLSVDELGGSAIVIGPEGIKQQFDLDRLNAKEVNQKFVIELLQSSKPSTEKTEAKNSQQESNDTKVLEKLDTILKRIESLEKEVQSLRKTE